MKVSKIYLLQTFTLLIGTIFAWFTVYTDFARFYNIYGNVTRISNCIIPNPVTTPCFYGAFAFLIAFIWSLKLLKNPKSQNKLVILLIGSTIFAWSNFTYEIFKFYASISGEQLSCSGIPTNNVFLTPCFYGSVIFLT